MPPIITAPLGHERTLSFELAEDAALQEAAGRLLARRYAWRGCGRIALQPARPRQRTTITAREAGPEGAILGTLTVAIDGDGLAAEQSFGGEVAALRRQGRRLAEFTRLAVELSPDSEQVLAALFHVGHALAHQLQGRDLLLIEVNPRHERCYARLLGALKALAAGWWAPGQGLVASA